MGWPGAWPMETGTHTLGLSGFRSCLCWVCVLISKMGMTAVVSASRMGKIN